MKTIANAEEKRIKELFYPLGLRWKNLAFIQAAREIEEKYGGRIPEARDEFIKLPGVIISVGYGKKERMVDSNMVRVFKRYFGIKPSREGRTDRHVVEMAKKYIRCKDTWRTNLAMLDFAALVCTPRNPACKRCSLK